MGADAIDSTRPRERTARFIRVSITKLEHLYVETHEWGLSVAFWSGLGFSFIRTWGSEGHRAGRLESGIAAVVLAEVPSEQPPTSSAFFTLEDPDDFSVGEAADVITPLQETHWGTRWMRVRKPEGRVYAFEADGETR
jgi:hypothetical protein